MKRGDTITCRVEHLSDQSDGVALVDGRQIAIRGAVPGDRARVQLGRKRKGRFDGHLLQIMEPGVRRIEPRCAHFGLCGGCRWQNLDYRDQLCLKNTMILSALSDAELTFADPDDIVPCDEIFHYRNKMEFSFASGQNGELMVGLHLRGRYNRVFDVEACCLQSDLSNRIVDAVRRHATLLQLPPYDLRMHTGLLRFLVIRQSRFTGEIMVNLVVAQYPHAGVLDLAREVIAQVPEISTWVVTLHQGKAQVALGQAEFVLHGSGMIVDGCNGVLYEISPRSFMQTNTRQAERLYRLVASMARDMGAARILDLYCGAGGISLQLAADAEGICGVESVEDAVGDARRNAVRNGISNCSFIAGTVESSLPELNGRGFDLVVVDPPRAGLHPKVKETLLDMQVPHVLYVSCNPRTMAADVAELTSTVYALRTMIPVDLFPHTPHCETIGLLQRC